jgi:hypothetical protein
MPVLSRTFIAKSRWILRDPDLASVIVRLSMAMNDIGMANEGLDEWTATLRNPKKKARQNGGRLYYGRMLMSHVFEALDIIKEIRSSSKLIATVQAADPQTRASFDAVVKFLSSPDFGLLAQIRNSASFHYDKTRARKGIEKIVAKSPDHESVYSMGVDPLDWYFEIGDVVNDRIVVREIFAVPESVKDVRAGIDPILTRMHQMGAAFSDFAGNFIRFCLKR